MYKICVIDGALRYRTDCRECNISCFLYDSYLFIFFFVLSVFRIPLCAAEDAGLERGNWIMLVDGDSITKKTEERLIDGGARTLRIGKHG